MRLRRSQWLLCLLAAVLNLGGGPMTWARASGQPDCHDAGRESQSEMSPDCAGHAPPESPSGPERDGPACCENGSCDCAVSHTLSPFDTRLEGWQTIFEEPSEFHPGNLPSVVIDDSLRPPIR
jgi:hypothetical protein